MLRVATVAFRASAIPLSERPASRPPCRPLASSDNITRGICYSNVEDEDSLVEVLVKNRSKAPSRCRRRRDAARGPRPVQISNTMTDVVQIDSDG